MPDSVPFQIDPTVADLGAGILVISGLLRYDETTVTLEFRTTDSRLAISDVREATIALADLAGIE